MTLAQHSEDMAALNILAKELRTLGARVEEHQDTVVLIVHRRRRRTRRRVMVSVGTTPRAARHYWWDAGPNERNSDQPYTCPVARPSEAASAIMDYLDLQERPLLVHGWRIWKKLREPREFTHADDGHPGTHP